MIESPDLQSIAAFAVELEAFADQAASSENYGLQDVCLLLSEALAASQPEQLDAESISLLNNFPELINTYWQFPQITAPQLLATLCHPSFNIELSPDEIGMLSSALLLGSDNGLTDTENTVSPAEQTQFICAIAEQLADEAANQGLYGVQDVFLLIGEALANLQTLSDDLQTSLGNLPLLYTNYLEQPDSATEALLACLCHPELGIILEAEELELISSQLLPPPTEPNLDEAHIDTPEIEPFESLSGHLSGLPGLIQQTQILKGYVANIQADDAVQQASSRQSLEDQLFRFSDAAMLAELSGLGLACHQVIANLEKLSETDTNLNAAHLALLSDWLACSYDYLQDHSNEDSIIALLIKLGDPDWPSPLVPEDAMQILANLRQEDATHYFAENSPARMQIASEDDISLALPDDVNQELLSILLQELPEQTLQFSEAIQRLQTHSNPKDLEIAQRIAHTIKGSANTVGITGIATLTHQLEDILVAFADAGKSPTINLLSVLSTAADCLEGMSESLLGMSAPPDNARTVLQNILDWANRIDQSGIDDLTDLATEALPVADTSNTPAATPTPISTYDNENEQAPAATSLRVSSAQIENLFRLSGESIIMNTQAIERLRQLKHQLQLMEQQFELLQKLGDELDQMIDLKDLSGRSQAHVSASFDSLEMDQYNELHTASRRMVEAAVDAREISKDAKKDLEQMGELLDLQQRIVIDSQEAAMQTRLVSIASIVPRLQRSLRQTCRLTGKQSDLNITGEHLQIDGDTLNAMIDPLMHLLRNAIDHGLEAPEERLDIGKSETGFVTISFEREGNSILVRCQDDGRGLDFAAIRASAEKKGLITPDQKVSEDELKRLILRPNFSTRSQTTQTSGRGVGMDVVNYQIKQLGGTLSMHSLAGQGLAVELKIPLPLSRLHALLANIGGYKVAITSKGLVRVHFPNLGEITETENGLQQITIEEQSYPQLGLHRVQKHPLINLRSLLRIPEKRNKVRTQNQSPVLLVENDGEIMAIQVDSLIGSMDLVIKNFGFYLQKIPGFAGSAILGDGKVAPVLDLPELIRTTILDEIDHSHERSAPVDEEQVPTILVVDDSLSQRRALEQLLNDVGFKTRSARDGMEAVEILGLFKPDIVLTDLEMPRMNGIELATHIRSKENLQNLPIIMVTSRTTLKHREMAEAAGCNYYLTKPVREDDLLEKIISLIGEITPSN